MAEYRYAGPDPVPDEDNELVHPGAVREFGAEPGWGPWERLGEPDAPPDTPPPGDVPPAPAKVPRAAPVTPEGNK